MPAAGKQLLQQACEEDKAMCVELPALLLFETARGESSPHYPYIRSLPEEPPRNLPTWTREQFRLLTAFLGKEHRSVAIYQGSACAINLPKLLPSLVPILEDSGLIPGATTDRGLGMSMLDRWAHGHATVMILGDVCTRACGFCNVATGRPRQVDPFEDLLLGPTYSTQQVLKQAGLTIKVGIVLRRTP